MSSLHSHRSISTNMLRAVQDRQHLATSQAYNCKAIREMCSIYVYYWKIYTTQKMLWSLMIHQTDRLLHPYGSRHAHACCFAKWYTYAYRVHMFAAFRSAVYARDVFIEKHSGKLVMFTTEQRWAEGCVFDLMNTTLFQGGCTIVIQYLKHTEF